MSSRSLTGSTLVRRRFSPVLSLFSVQLLSSFFGLVKSPPCFGRRLRCDVHVRDADAVRDPTTWTILQKDGPNHLRLRYNVLPAHQMALITSGCAPFRVIDQGFAKGPTAYLTDWCRSPPKGCPAIKLNERRTIMDYPPERWP